MHKSQISFQPSVQFSNPKCITPKQLLSIFSRSQMNKERLLKQLEQLDIDINPLERLTLHEIYNHVEPVLKNTYSIKYLGLNKNQMGIVSRRIDPTRDPQNILDEPPEVKYTINKYFYPKPLKVGKKAPREQQINVDNLQTEIKKSFQSTKAKRQNKTIIPQINDKKRKQVHGSWLSIGKVKNTIYNEKRQKLKNIDPSRINLNELSSTGSKLHTSSYANLLSKGILLVKDY